MDIDGSDDDKTKSISKASGGRGGRGSFRNFGERTDPLHKGEKDVPEGEPECLAGLTFVISGTLDSLEREEAEDLIKCYGGRVTGSASKKMNYLLCDEDIGGWKSTKAKELSTGFLTEDGLFDKFMHRIKKNLILKEILRDLSLRLLCLHPRRLPKKKNQKVDLEELAERVSGDMCMALNQLQYMSLSKSTIKYDDIRQRLLGSAKDEDISPFTAVDKLFGFNAGKLRMDERVDLSMSDPHLVPLIIQENYINYRPSSVSNDDNGLKRLNLVSWAADSFANGDIVNVQIRRYRQWQLSQTENLASCITP